MQSRGDRRADPLTKRNLELMSDIEMVDRLVEMMISGSVEARGDQHPLLLTT